MGVSKKIHQKCEPMRIVFLDPNLSVYNHFRQRNSLVGLQHAVKDRFTLDRRATMAAKSSIDPDVDMVSKVG